MKLPSFRVDVQLSTHQEGDEHYLVLHDPFGIAEGPIMLHADMIDILSLCDGETTIDDVAASAGVDLSGPEIMQIQLFIAELDKMGYFDGPQADARRDAAVAEWSQLPARPPVCAGTTYPAEPEALRQFLDGMETGIEVGVGQVQPPSMVLLPHIDFRVAPEVYGKAFAHVRSSMADLVVMIGTSHYWDTDPIIVTNKPFESPLGVVPVIEHPFYNPESDIAHKPEHSLELHAVLLQHLWQGRTFEILPVLVTQAALEPNVLHNIAAQLKNFVDSTGREALWLISGDLAHVGKKFGDEHPAAMYTDIVRAEDQGLINALEDNNLAEYRASIERQGNAYRVCGYAPTILAHSAHGVGKGRAIAYDMWDEFETQSSVSFATIIWD
jgi:AmmeMemoRadiSam system protein B